MKVLPGAPVCVPRPENTASPPASVKIVVKVCTVKEIDSEVTYNRKRLYHSRHRERMHQTLHAHKFESHQERNPGTYQAGLENWILKELPVWLTSAALRVSPC